LKLPPGPHPLDAIVTLWVKAGTTGMPLDLRWPGAKDAAIVIDIESIEAATQTLGL
jgi:hypothetical protein